MKPDVGSKSRFVHTSPAFLRGVLVRILLAYAVWYGKTRMAWLPESEKKFEDTITRFDRTHKRDRQTDTA